MIGCWPSEWIYWCVYIYIYIYIYTDLLQSCREVYTELQPVLFLSASLGHWAGKQLLLFILHIRVVISTSLLSPSLWVGQVVWGLHPSLSPGLSCGNSLDRAQGILNDWRHGDVYVACLVGGSIAAHVPLPEDVKELGCKSGALLGDVIGTDVAFCFEVGADLILHFIRKRYFLSVILIDPSTLIWYWLSGRTVMIFLLFSTHDWVGFVWQLCHLLVTGEGCGYICYNLLLFLHCGWDGGGFSCMLCHCYSFKVWLLEDWLWRNGITVDSGIGVVPVIEKYLGLGCFGTARWPRQHCQFPRNPAGMCFHSLSSLQFSLWALPSHWIGDAWLRIVCA